MFDRLSAITLRKSKDYTDSHGGGGGGTSDYRELSHLPKINSVELIGNKSLSDLGIENNVQADWNEADSAENDFIKNKPTLGSLASKDSVSGSYTPSGSVSVTKGDDTTSSIGSMTGVGTLPALTIDGTKLKFSAGALPTKSDISVVTASGSVTASFSGTQATITAE